VNADRPAADATFGSEDVLSRPPGCLVVGVDGSAEGLAALRWAHTLAGSLAARLIVVHAVGLLEGAGLQPAIDVPTVVASLTEGSEGDRGAVAVEPVIEPGTPPDVLLRVAVREGADLVVVGSRGLGGTSFALGSTSEAVLTRARVPVVVLPAQR
jgi:nucleotide-binding universal stress UspA family protein